MSTNPIPVGARSDELEPPLAAVEERLGALSAALGQRDAGLIEVEAAALHRALASALDGFGRAARRGAIPHTLRRRLMVATGQVAAQREVLARATAALDRAIDVLLPGAGAAVYAADGSGERVARGADLHG